MMETTVTRNKFAPRIYAFFVFLSLSGIYIMPERIKIFVSLFMVGLGLYFIFYNARFRINKATIGLLAYLFVGIVATLFNNDVAFSTALNFVISMVTAALVLSVDVDKYTASCLTKAFVGIMSLVVVGCILQLFFPSLLLKINRITLGEEKYVIFYDSFFQYGFLVGFSYQTGVTGYYLALFAGYILSCIFANVYTNDTRKKVFYILLFAIVFWLLFSTAKRIELAVVVLAFFILLYLYEKNRPVRFVGIIFILLLAIVILLFATEIGRRLISRTFGDNPTSGRTKIYGWVWGYFKQNPVLGNGFGSTVTYISEYTNGHNIYLQSLMEAGVVGFVALAYSLISHVKCSIGVSKRIKKYNTKDRIISGFYLFIVLNFIITGAFGNPLYDVYPLFGYAIAVAIIQAYSTNNSMQKSQERESLYEAS